MRFDVIPRALSPEDWEQIETGSRQRVTAINLFLNDIHHKGRILKDGVVPANLIKGNDNYQPAMAGLDLLHGTYVHICGIDLIRDGESAFRVLEDNGRTPSGVSYVVENRHLMMRAFPDLSEDLSIKDVSDYGVRLHAALYDIAAPAKGDP